jgi:hypothetical protein
MTDRRLTTGHIDGTKNMGSDTISVFEVKQQSLRLFGSFYSGGARPISLTVDRNLLYVLNAGGTVV